MEAASRRVIYLTEFDRRRLAGFFQVLRSRTALDHPRLQALEADIEHAKVLDVADMPSNVVTMNSRVRLRDLDTGDLLSLTLVFPGAAEASKGRVSVLAPVGLAMLGARESDELRLPMLKRVRPRRLRIEEVEYQPEAAGDTAL
jgi:regulator of nucleoside diphosphate kinase